MFFFSIAPLKYYSGNYFVGYSSESVVSFAKIISQLLSGKVVVEKLPLVIRNFRPTTDDTLVTNNADDKNNDEFSCKDSERISE